MSDRTSCMVFAGVYRVLARNVGKPVEEALPEIWELMGGHDFHPIDLNVGAYLKKLGYKTNSKYALVKIVAKP